MTRIAVVLGLLIGLLAPAQASARAVAIVYDDSASMRNEDRWRFASFSLQTVLALLGEADKVHVIRMSDPGRAASYDGVAERRAAIGALASQRSADATSTPFQAVETALAALRGDNDTDRWLAVITDGGFTAGPDGSGRRAIAETAAQRDRIKTIFMLMGKGADQQVADLWARYGHGQTFSSRNNAEIIDRMNDIAAVLMMRPTGANDLRPKSDGNVVTLSPLFPLRRLTLLQQTRAPSGLVKVASATAGSDALLADEWLAEMPAGGRERNSARVTHLKMARDAQVMPEGPDSIRIAFSGGVDRKEIRFLPEVAARFEIELRDEKSQVLAPDPEGAYIICRESTATIVGKLTTDDGRPLALGMADPSALRVVLTVAGDAAERVMSPDVERKQFSTTLQINDPEVRISASAAYPGYFNFKSNLFTLRSRDCTPRTVTLRTRQGRVEGSWRGRVTELDRAEPLEIIPLIDGRPIDVAEFAGWTLAADSSGPKLKIATGDGKWIVTTDYRWCTPCFTPAGRFKFDWKLATGRSDDRLLLPTDFLFEIEDAPLWERCWRIVLTVLLALIALWYVIAIFNKPRFARNAIVHYRREGPVPAMPRSFILPGSWFWRLVPWGREKKVVDDLVFLAGPNRRKTTVYLARRCVRKSMRIDGQPILSDDVGAAGVDVPIESGTEIEIVLDRPERDRKKYRFEASGRR